MPSSTSTTTLTNNMDNYRLVRERSFTSSHDDLVQIILQLRTERATGTLTINLSQGGINRVQFREEQDIRYQNPNHVK